MTGDSPLTEAQIHYREIKKWIKWVEEKRDKNEGVPGHVAAAAMNLRFQFMMRGIGEALEEMKAKSKVLKPGEDFEIEHKIKRQGA